MYAQTLIFITAILLTPIPTSANCIYGTSLFPRAAKIEVSNFGYTGLQGPLNWAGLSPENSACATSKVQSPINIDSTIQLAKESPKVSIPSVRAAEFINLGTTIEVEVNGTTRFGGSTFNLQQFHFHTPSEHRVSEEHFPLEVHMVHEAADGSNNIVVIALTFQLSENGTTTSLLPSVIRNLSKITSPGTATETGPLDFKQVINHIQTTPLFQYSGSLTTPPCAEGLTFLVTKDPLPLDVKTYNRIKSVVKFNSRYTQNKLNQDNLVAVGATALSGTDRAPNNRTRNKTVTREPSPSSLASSPTATAKGNVEGNHRCILGACHKVPRRMRG